MPTFNLVDEPWIPCVRNAINPPNQTKASLRQVLTQASTVEGIAHPSPLVTVAIHRLLVAILHRNIGPSSLDEWRHIWNAKQWDNTRVNGYLDHWRERFDLFDPTHPFYQVPQMKDADVQPTSYLMHETASGNNATLFDHSFEEAWTPLSPADAACYLLARQAFSIGFGKSKPFYFSDAPLVRGFTLLARGDDLVETLLLNLLVYNPERPLPHTGEDLPWWEQKKPIEPDRNGTAPLGYLDYLTWQSRRIHLHAEGEPPQVMWCQVQQNLKLEGTILDPFKSYRRDKERGFLPRGLARERAVWRDSHTLLEEVGPSEGRPELIRWLARIEEVGRGGSVVLKPRYTLSILGFATEPGKAGSIVLWRNERLPLPIAYLGDKDLLDTLKNALRVAEEVRTALTQAIRALARVVLVPDGETTNALSRGAQDRIAKLRKHLGAEPNYWARLEAPFRRFMVALAEDARPGADGGQEYGATELPRWAEDLRHAARETFDEAVRGLDGSTRVLKARARAESAFNRGLREVLGPWLETNSLHGGTDDNPTTP